MTSETDEREQRMLPVLTAHLGHHVTVNGWPTIITAESTEPQRMTWRFGGFAVDCTTCGVNLSQQWQPGGNA